MKNLQVKTTRVIEDSITIPEYFKIDDSQYYRIVNEKTYVLVYFHDLNKETMEALTIYPEIQVKRVDHLYIHVQGKDIVEITKEQFTEQFDACMTFIDQL